MNIDEALITAGIIQFLFFVGPVVLISALILQRVYRANHPAGEEGFFHRLFHRHGPAATG